MTPTILDTLLADQQVIGEVHRVQPDLDNLVHVVGAQEPVRSQPDGRARTLLSVGWLTVEHIHIDLPDALRAAQVRLIQGAARAWVKNPPPDASTADREQVRWLVEKTRTHESVHQISQRVWLALVLYHLGCRGVTFDAEGQILWEGGAAGRIGLSPDAAIDLAWEQPSHQTYAASFRQQDGTIVRGKGRQRWEIYRLTIHPDAAVLFAQRAKRVDERVALIVASETFATQPQLPRDFYGGDTFQQACIDAQDQQFDHILVLSPEHGVISLDEVVPSEQLWDRVMERSVWFWQITAHNRLGRYLLGAPKISLPQANQADWWSWLNPASCYTLTVFGSGFAPRILIDHLLHLRARSPQQWPELVLGEGRPGYDVGDLDSDFGFNFFLDDYDDDEDDDDDEAGFFETALHDLEELLDWASEFVNLVNLYLPPISETWEIAPDEALVPVRLLTETSMDLDELFDLLTDITLVLNHPLPFSALLSANQVVLTLLQITHSLVHNDREPIPSLLDTLAEPALRQYVENALQEASQEDRLCACLTLAEQMQLLGQVIPSSVNDQLLVWFQTYLSSRMRHHMTDLSDDEE